MEETLQKIVDDLNSQGYGIFKEDAEQVRKLCERKMDICHIKDREAYLPVLFADEIMNFVIRRMITNRSLYTERSTGLWRK